MKRNHCPPESSAETLLDNTNPEALAAFVKARRRVLVRMSGDPSCYCESDMELIKFDLEHSSIPADALTKHCCWRQICRVRGCYPESIDRATWSELCRLRGLVLTLLLPSVGSRSGDA